MPHLYTTMGLPGADNQPVSVWHKQLGGLQIRRKTEQPSDLMASVLTYRHAVFRVAC
jgi:hypothetical protein